MQTTSMYRQLVAAARRFIQLGFYVIPIASGKKHPTLKKWQDLRIGIGNLKKYFCHAAGIGLLLQSSKLADVDCDCPEAVIAAGILLPATDMVHGHRSNPESHRYYRYFRAIIRHESPAARI